MTPPRYTRALPVLVVPILLLAAACTTVRPAAPPPRAAPVVRASAVFGPPAPRVLTDRLPDTGPSPALATIAGGPVTASGHTSAARTRPGPSRPPTRRPSTRPPRVNRAPHAGTPTDARLHRSPANACDGLAAGGVFPAGSAWHRWCHAQKRPR